jgi:hypothetical protein
VSAIFPPPEKKRQSVGVIVIVAIVGILALTGVIETAVLITLAMTGQIG